MIDEIGRKLFLISEDRFFFFILGCGVGGRSSFRRDIFRRLLWSRQLYSLLGQLNVANATKELRHLNLQIAIRLQYNSALADPRVREILLQQIWPFVPRQVSFQFYKVATTVFENSGQK